MQKIPALTYQILPLERLELRSIPSPAAAKKKLSDLTARCEVRLGSGDWMRPTQRFWGSMFSLFGISASIFRYFGHQEVLERICARRTAADLRFCVEPAGKGRDLLLAVSSTQREPLGVRDVRSLISKHEPRLVSYQEGVASLTMIPKSGAKDVKIGSELFRNEFVVDVPLDGYGGPSTYLSLLRYVCENGATARVPEFRSDIMTGKGDPVHALNRALDTFDNEEGYSALRGRFEASQRTPASLRECLSLLQHMKPLGPEALKRYHKAVGDLNSLYGLANLQSISEKKQRVVPAKCTVYDLLNAASEVTTHVVGGYKALRTEAWMGSLLREEYDLEGVAVKAKDFMEMFGPPAGSA